LKLDLHLGLVRLGTGVAMSGLAPSGIPPDGARVRRLFHLQKPRSTMKRIRSLIIAGFLALLPNCATTTTNSTTWTEESQAQHRFGQVAWVREHVQHRNGDPAGGAIAGAIIGGILGGGHGPSALLGAAGGAAIGAAASEGHSEARFYDVAVRFQDGTQRIFRYADFAPFQPGEQVVQTPQGLARS
jgi:outer membrane lipoprotein SlyB